MGELGGSDVSEGSSKAETKATVKKQVCWWTTLVPPACSPATWFVFLLSVVRGICNRRRAVCLRICVLVAGSVGFVAEDVPRCDMNSAGSSTSHFQAQTLKNLSNCRSSWDLPFPSSVSNVPCKSCQEVRRLGYAWLSSHLEFLVCSEHGRLQYNIMN